MQNTPEKLSFNPEMRAEADFVTWAAEALEGQMRTPTEYRYDPMADELIAEDGSEVGAIFTDALREAESFVEDAPQLAFELRRRGPDCELGEYHDMLAMMRGESPNTMVVVSDFPPELMEYPVDVGGYNVRRKQTFLRVLHRDAQTNRLKMYSQTLDASDREGLEALYSELGFKAQSGELLGQRMYLDVEDGQQEILVDRLTRVYDKSMTQKFSGHFEAGMRMNGQDRSLNTYDFIQQQKDIVRHAVQEVLSGRFDVEGQYDTIALLAHRYQLARHKEMPQNFVRHQGSIGDIAIQRSLLSQELAVFGRQARLEGKSFSGCGVTLDSNQLFSVEAQLDSDGYGNKTDDKAEKYAFDAYQYCVECQAPPKEDEKKQWCGPCGLCRGCDKKAGGKG